MGRWSLQCLPNWKKLFQSFFFFLFTMLMNEPWTHAHYHQWKYPLSLGFHYYFGCPFFIPGSPLATLAKEDSLLSLSSHFQLFCPIDSIQFEKLIKVKITLLEQCTSTWLTKKLQAESEQLWWWTLPPQCWSPSSFLVAHHSQLCSGALHKPGFSQHWTVVLGLELCICGTREGGVSGIIRCAHTSKHTSG